MFAENGAAGAGFGSYFSPFLGVVLSLRLVKGVERTRSGHAAFKTAFESWTYVPTPDEEQERKEKKVCPTHYYLQLDTCFIHNIQVMVDARPRDNARDTGT
ncbi:hypothetical protein PPROV_000067000 [Pycnococcus provasolii]|uniref:Uncharacterized protein n=1 Tax=Pycnococcus provasolii TaxID=41880 RepID=A0A830H6K2_9CHLO|nr:hypothetical protein PPROV_000067000 [Pycnococcus provasolii]